MKLIEQDMTFGQHIAPFGKPSENYYSFDLTAATDRIPIKLYREKFVVWFGTEWADAWVDLKIKLPFSYNGG